MPTHKSAAPPPRVLIVDDDAEVREVLRRFLGGKGYAPQTADGGEQALEMLEAFAPRLVLLDLHMPGLGGLETLRRLRSRRPAAAVFMISGHGDDETARICLALGASDFIVKPFDFEYLELSLWAKILTLE